MAFEWVAGLFQSEEARGLSGESGSSVALDDSNPYYNYRLRRHKAQGDIVADPALLWYTSPYVNQREGLGMHIAAEVGEGVANYTDVLMILNQDDFERSEQMPGEAWNMVVGRLLQQEFENFCRRENFRRPHAHRPLGFRVLADGSDAMHGTTLGLGRGEFITGLLPKFYTGPVPGSHPVIGVHVNLPGIWEGYQEVGRLHNDQILFTLGNHWLDNFSHPALAEGALYRLQQYPDGNFVHIVNPDLQDRYQVTSTVQNNASVLTLATREGVPLAYLVLAVMEAPDAESASSAEADDAPSISMPLARPSADSRDDDAIPLVAPPMLIDDMLQPVPSSGAQMGGKTIIPDAPAERIFTLQERGALLQKVHFSAFMLGYDVFMGSRGELGTKVEDPAATFQVRKRSTSFVSHTDGVSVGGRMLQSGEQIALDGDTDIVLGDTRLEYRDLRAHLAVTGWPYVAEIRRPASSTYLIWGEEYHVGRSRECRVVLPDQTSNDNIHWKPKVGAGAYIRARTGDIPKANFYTDSIMVSSEHATVDLRAGDPSVACNASHCYVFVRRGDDILAVYPTSKEGERHSLNVQPGDEVLVGNCLFQVGYSPAEDAVAPAPAPEMQFSADMLADSAPEPAFDEEEEPAAAGPFSDPDAPPPPPPAAQELDDANAEPEYEDSGLAGAAVVGAAAAGAAMAVGEVADTWGSDADSSDGAAGPGEESIDDPLSADDDVWSQNFVARDEARPDPVFKTPDFDDDPARADDHDSDAGGDVSEDASPVAVAFNPDDIDRYSDSDSEALDPDEGAGRSDEDFGQDHSFGQSQDQDFDQPDDGGFDEPGLGQEEDHGLGHEEASGLGQEHDGGPDQEQEDSPGLEEGDSLGLEEDDRLGLEEDDSLGLDEDDSLGLEDDDPFGHVDSGFEQPDDDAGPGFAQPDHAFEEGIHGDDADADHGALQPLDDSGDPQADLGKDVGDDSFSRVDLSDIPEDSADLSLDDIWDSDPGVEEPSTPGVASAEERPTEPIAADERMDELWDAEADAAAEPEVAEDENETVMWSLPSRKDPGLEDLPIAGGLGEEGFGPEPIDADPAGPDSILGDLSPYGLHDDVDVPSVIDNGRPAVVEMPVPREPGTAGDDLDLHTNPDGLFRSELADPEEGGRGGLPLIDELADRGGFDEEDFAANDTVAPSPRRIPDEMIYAPSEVPKPFPELDPENAPPHAQADPGHPGSEQGPESFSDSPDGRAVVFTDDAEAQFELGRPCHLILAGWMVNGEVLIGNYVGADLVLPENRIVESQTFEARDYLKLKIRGRRGTMDVLAPSEVLVDEADASDEQYTDLENKVIDVIRRDDAGEEDFAIRLQVQQDRALPDPRARLIALDYEDPLAAALVTRGLPKSQARTLEIESVSLTLTFNGETVAVSDYFDTYREPDGSFKPFFVQRGGKRFKTAPEDGATFQLASGDRIVVGHSVYVVREE